MLLVPLVIAALVGIPPLPAGAATPAFVQVSAAVPQSNSATTVAAKYTAAQTAGNLNVVVVGWNDVTASVSSVTDTSGNVYKLAVGPTAGTALTQAIYYAGNIAPAAANANTVTVSFTSGAAYPDVRILEYSGIDPTTPVDVTAAAKGSSSTSSTSSVTTTNASDLLFAANMVATSTKAAGTGFTSRTITNPDGDIAEDRLVSATGGYTASATLSSSGAWIMQMVAFRAVGSVPPPTAPSNLTAAAGSSTQVNLSWNPSTGGTGTITYLVERCSGAGCSTFTQIASPSGTTYGDTGLSAATSYTYRVRAIASGVFSPYSNTATIITAAAPPPTAPSNLTATPVSSSQINLTWSASTGGQGTISYLVERCSGAGCPTFSQIGTASGTTYTDTGLNASTAYTYQVRATASGVTSGYSNTAATSTAAAPPPSVPANLAASAVSNTQINLTWTASTSGVGTISYLVERCGGSGCTNFVQVGTAPGATYTDGGLTASTTYTYQVRATAAGVPSGYSNTAFATTLASGTIATPKFVQVKAATPQSQAVSTVSATYSSAQTAGDLNVVIVGWNDNTASVSSVTDTVGNTYKLAVGPTVGTELSQSMYYASNIAAAAAGANSVKVAFSPSAAYPDVRVVEYSGIDPVYPADSPNPGVGASGTTGDPVSPAYLTANANDVLIGADMVATGTAGAGTGFTSRIITTPDSDIAEDRVATSSAAYTATASQNGVGAWVMQLAAFRAAGSPAPAPVPPVVAITAPKDGSTIAGSVTVSALANGYSPITFVQFKLDGVNLGSAVTASPYAVTWDTSAQTPGTQHVLTAITQDTSGRSTTSSAVTVVVQTAAQIGQWEAPVTTPIVSVHSMLLPSGDIMMFDGQDSGLMDRVWNLAANVFTAVNSPVNIFCSGITSLADGRTFVAGGHNNAAHSGLNITETFNFLTRSWTSGPKMANPRWYPTTTTLPDGRVLILSGETTCDQCDVVTPEIYDPKANTVSQLTGANQFFTYYPHTFVLPDGRVLVSSTAETPTISQVLDMNAKTWTPVGTTALDGGTAVMYQPGKILKLGTSVDPDDPTRSSVNTAYVLDMTQSSPNWRQVAPMADARTYANSVVLPDGNVWVEGGGTTTAPTDASTAVYASEMWSPTTESFSTTAAGAVPRLYHSEALLLPDGRVMVAGGGRFDNGTATTDRFSAEFYDPPYLFKGARPTISSAPATLQYNTSFTVQTPDAGSIASVVMVRLPSVTHSINMSQAFVPLSFSATSGSLNVTAAANGNLAPPGYYMLFIVNANGVPSVAPIVSIS
jgi:hypothetical protein